ncbi:MAG: cobalt transporter CbiM [Alphaproteobacteria bacterium]|nr:cobalt transporter CbiM [Alphaproteobacteria bacterium]
MHISEGILSAPILLGGGVLTVIGIAIGLKKLDYDRIMGVAILSSTFFVASLIHIPLGPGSVHLVLNGLLGVMLGWVSFPAIFVALLLQAIFFQYGGIVVLGVNTFNMAVPALLCFYLLRPWLEQSKYRSVAGFIGGFLSVFLASMFMALALTLSDSGFISTAKIVVIAHLPVMIIEGFITMFIISFLTRVKPEILQLGIKKLGIKEC